MRKLPLILLLVGSAFPAFASRRVTVEQLEQVLAATHGKPDAEVARQLSDLELTQRLSSVKLSHLEADLPGTETRQALIALADVSAFLDLPGEEIPDTAKPDIPTQRQLMAQAIDYVGKTISKLPNFFATRVTIHFEDTPPGRSEKGQTINTLYQPLHSIGRSSANVLYRDGQEVVDPGASKGKNSGAITQGLTTSGEFGPILATVLVDAAQGKLMWSHWEQGAAGLQAVFRYAIPREKSHYQVQFCCVPGDNGNRTFQQFSGYHGEIAVDPTNGRILRLTLEAELKPTDPIVKANMLVEYGPVEIGGKTYLCPVKSISVSQIQPLHSLLKQDPRTGNVTQDTQDLSGPIQTLVNDVAFEHYHVFTASAHLVTGHNGVAAEAPASSPANPGSSEAGNPGSVNVDSTPVKNAPPVASAASNAAVVSTASNPSSNAAPAAAPLEISVADSTGLPDIPASPRSDSPEKSAPPQSATRLVDIGVTVYDKKNHPVTDLTSEDFEIYDNGRRQAIRFFSRPSSTAIEESSNAPTPFSYSNRRAASANAGPKTGDVTSNITVFLIDAHSLTWEELTYVRGQVLKFLRGSPPNDRVALYVLQALGFHVLQEDSTDHALLEAKLSEWLPSSQELARAQAEERRNQQQSDVTPTQSDLQTVSGTSSQAPNSGSLVDPALRQLSSNPGRDTLSIMVGLAHHLAAIPGHKNLVWITSDNALSASPDKPGSTGKGNKYVDELAQLAQEAMNDAHVSVYPLDATQTVGAAAVQVHPESNQAQTTNMPTAANMPHSPNTVEMQPNLHTIQGPIRTVADATGGRPIHRSGDIAAALNKVLEDGQATYLLSFSPDVQADGQYHTLDVKLPTRRGVTLHYRTHYQYTREPATLKDRFGQVIWQSSDANEIGVSANATTAPTGAALKLDIAASDLGLARQEERWVDDLDIFVVQRSDDGVHARITGKTLILVLKPDTYQRSLKEGITFNQPLEINQNTDSVRVVVVDENSGRMGSITIPSAALLRKP
jgi:VWFA-related protein